MITKLSLTLTPKFIYPLLLLFFSICSFSQNILINYENFESGNFPFTLWNDGGSDCSLNSSSILSGTDSANLQDNSGSSSSMFTNNIDLTPYASVELTFDFRTVGFNSGHDFFIEYSNNGGSSWVSTPIARYILGTNFNNNTTYTNQSVTINNGGTYGFTSNSRFRFRSDASSNRDDIYIDEIIINGTLSGPPQPEINITGLGNTISNGDNSPSNSDNTNYGSVNTGSLTNHIFTIQNTSSSETNLTISDNGSGISISGGFGYFTINSEPTQNSTISGGNNLTFSIDYIPLTDGTHTATISIDNDDSNEDPYTFTIQGTSISPNPEIDVKGNGANIANGDLYPTTFNNTNFGSVDIGNSSTKTYTINNTGISTLNISSITLSNSTDFEIVGTPYNATVNSGNSTAFNVRYTGASGKHSSTVTIESDDADEGTYTFVIRASSKATGDTSLWSVTNITSDSELNNPYEITYGPDNKLWISERVGKKIVTVNTAGGSKSTILDLSGLVYQTAGQDGLMGFAIHPDLYTDINTSNNLVYIAYTYDAGGGSRKLRIASYRYIAGTGLLDSGTATTIIEGIDASNDHNSGRMKIGPDFKIYYTIGDQGANQFGNACNPIQAQDLPSSSSDYDPYKGKVLRLNLDGTVPADNPTLNSVKSHVYTYGHRNPQGIIFGSNGKLYASEHGAKVDDELNIITAGKNYGWPHIAGYYDNLAYSYCNWSSQGGSCSTSGFTDHNCPSGVTSVTEYDAANNSILSNFQPPIGTYDSTTNYDPSGNWLTWPTVAPSSIDIYEAGLIPNWGQSLLITTLKEGTIFRAKLNTAGDALVDITSDNKFEEFHSSNDRYRDIAMDPDGITFYAITDSSGTTSGPSGSSSVTLSNPGVVMKFQYIGPVPTTTTYYVDVDEDGFGDINDTTGTEYSSDPGAGYSLTNDDCNDNQPLAYPGNTEILYDGIDNDCDSLTLDTLDADGDGVNSDTDCDDNQPLAYPGNTEVLYDGIDNDCNPLTLDTEDADNDGVNSDTDCDDNQPLAYPGNTEILYDGIDNDCDPLTLDTEDVDNDGVNSDTDCDDNQSLAYPGNTEILYDGIDNDCDPLTLDTEDADNDGVNSDTDCDDNQPLAYPGNTEILYDGIDNDCNPLTLDYEDTDGDGVIDSEDQCPGFDDNIDVDSDGIPDGCDSLIDSDNDGIADSEDQCLGFDDTADSDSDGIPDGCDTCPGFDDSIDVDADGTPDGCDNLIDSDNDGVADSKDLCPGFDDTIDVDTDGIPDDCDSLIDSDNDGVADSEDVCPGFDDNIDIDNDGIPDDCDSLIDSDNDGVSDTEDQCPGFDDNVDIDADNIPDDCDPLIDSDNDGVADSEDVCPGFDDNIDTDADGIPDDCDTLIDSDNDGIADSEDLCPGFDDTVDGDNDGIPTGCDPDDNDPCIPDSNSPACNTCSDIIVDNFEGSYGNWNDGGNDSALSASNANTGSYSIRLRDNSGTSSSMYTNSLDLSGLSEISINFSYYSISMENGEDFFLEISTNGGSSYSIIQTWARGTHFNNNTRYNESVNVYNATYGFTNNSVLRIRCDASGNNDQIYIDDVTINSCANGQTAKKQTAKTTATIEIDNNILIESKTIKVYPNPASYELFIKAEGVNSNSDVKLYTIIGQLVRHINMISNELKIDLNGLSEGLYLVKISNEKGELIKADRIIIKVD